MPSDWCCFPALDISREQYAVLSGAGFTVFYALMSLVAGSLADRGNRKKVAGVVHVCEGIISVSMLLPLLPCCPALISVAFIVFYGLTFTRIKCTQSIWGRFLPNPNKLLSTANIPLRTGKRVSERASAAARSHLRGVLERSHRPPGPLHLLLRPGRAAGRPGHFTGLLSISNSCVVLHCFVDGFWAVIHHCHLKVWLGANWPKRIFIYHHSTNEPGFILVQHPSSTSVCVSIWFMLLSFAVFF